MHHRSNITAAQTQTNDELPLAKELMFYVPRTEIDSIHINDVDKYSGFL